MRTARTLHCQREAVCYQTEIWFIKWSADNFQFSSAKLYGIHVLEMLYRCHKPMVLKIQVQLVQSLLRRLDATIKITIRSSLISRHDSLSNKLSFSNHKEQCNDKNSIYFIAFEFYYGILLSISKYRASI